MELQGSVEHILGGYGLDYGIEQGMRKHFAFVIYLCTPLSWFTTMELFGCAHVFLHCRSCWHGIFHFAKCLSTICNMLGKSSIANVILECFKMFFLSCDKGTPSLRIHLIDTIFQKYIWIHYIFLKIFFSVVLLLKVFLKTSVICLVCLHIHEFCLFYSPDVELVQHCIQLVLGVAHEWHGADHSPPSSSRVSVSGATRCAR